jgi:hypothetical protein
MFTCQCNSCPFRDSRFEFLVASTCNLRLSLSPLPASIACPPVSWRRVHLYLAPCTLQLAPVFASLFPLPSPLSPLPSPVLRCRGGGSISILHPAPCNLRLSLLPSSLFPLPSLASPCTLHLAPCTLRLAPCCCYIFPRVFLASSFPKKSSFASVAFLSCSFASFILPSL